MKNPITIACPHCKKEVAWDTNNLFRPFCSQRCKLIDLGDWIEEKHVIVDQAPETVDHDLSDDMMR